MFQTFVGMDAVAAAPALLVALAWPIALLLDLSAVDQQTLDSACRGPWAWREGAVRCVLWLRQLTS